MRRVMVNTLLHAGWALMGQECDCGGWPNLNALARAVGASEWDHERDRPARASRRAMACVGSKLLHQGIRFDR